MVVSTTVDGDTRTDDKDEFFRIVQTEGVTLDGSYYATTGTGKATRYHEYDTQVVSGLARPDGMDEQKAEAAGITEVENHEEALLNDLKKADLEPVFEKYTDGFGHSGIAIQEEAPEPDDEDDDVPDMTAEEAAETIRQNYDEHGLFAEDEDGEQKVVSLAHPDARLMGYITGSHVGSLPVEGMDSVDDYREAVFHALGADLADTDDDAEPIVAFGSPDDVPIATDDMMAKFEASGQRVAEDEDLKEKLSEQVKNRWEDGEYDHLRKEDEEPEDDGGD